MVIYVLFVVALIIITSKLYVSVRKHTVGKSWIADITCSLSPRWPAALVYGALSPLLLCVFLVSFRITEFLFLLIYYNLSNVFLLQFFYKYTLYLYCKFIFNFFNTRGSCAIAINWSWTYIRWHYYYYPLLLRLKWICCTVAHNQTQNFDIFMKHKMVSWLFNTRVFRKFWWM